MKRVGGLKEQILDYDNIALGAYKAFKGHRSKSNVLTFCGDFDANIRQIMQSLEDESIALGQYTYFKIFDPKERLICAASLTERIVHHAIMNVCHKYFDRKLIYDSYASRLGKGVYKAINRVKAGLSSHPYFVKLDIRKYFDSVDHSTLLKMLNTMFKDRWLLHLFERIINSYETMPGKGLPIGNLTSQYFANLYLSPIDHHMKEDVKAPVYVRYMDDVVMLTDSRDEARRLASVFIEYANRFLRLEVKPPIIGKGRNGVPFLGYRIMPQRIELSGRSKRRFRHKLLLYSRLLSEGEITEQTYGMRVTQLCAFTQHSDSISFRKDCLRLIIEPDNQGYAS